jgi:23S rRNA G2069 N7-methylase RlmK/C1962 C5-methylase RlmI
MSAAAAAALEMDPAKVVLKQRRRQRGADQYNRQRHTEHELVVREREARFCVNLVDYIDTGLFLDHRETRRMVKEAADGKDVLNLFGYTGAFSVYAALGNAASTRTVDLSRAYLDWAGHNFALNNLLIDAKHGFIRADAPTYVRDLHPDICFDLAIVDPPTFSNSKALQRDWNVQRDHRSLLCQLAPHIRHGGLVFFSTNFRRFKFDGLEMPYSSIREISRQTVPEDFRNRRIHRCWRLQR